MKNTTKIKKKKRERERERELNCLEINVKALCAFTLIELLVVIAIIGILAAIVLAALGSARTSAKEASILSTLRQAQTQAELYHVNNSSYSGLCSDSKIQEIVTSASSTGDGAVCWEATNSSDLVENSPTSQQGLAMIDYGIGAKLDDTYYGASPLGSGTFDIENSGGANNNTWNEAKQLCGDVNKRLPSPSVVRAIYGIANDTPEGFAESGYWSALESPADSSEAFLPYMPNGGVYQNPKTDTSNVRCVN